MSGERRGPLGRPPALSAEQREQMRRRREAGEKLAALAEAFGVTEPTAWAYCQGIPWQRRPRVYRARAAA